MVSSTVSRDPTLTRHHLLLSSREVDHPPMYDDDVECPPIIHAIHPPYSVFFRI